MIDKAVKNGENSQKYASKAIEYANLAMSTVIPYDSGELKGVWIRPTYFSEDEIIKTIDKIYDAGILNEITFLTRR